jgi:hypothetical protein
MPIRDASRPSLRLAALLMGLVILVGSLMLVAIPVAWLWVLSRLGQPYLAVYFLALAGCPIMMVAWGIALLRLNRVYARLSGSGEQARQMLEMSIALAVLVGILSVIAWLLLYSHGGGPAQGPWPG